MKSDFMKWYEELEQLTEEKTSANDTIDSKLVNDYEQYTAESLVSYKMFWPSAWASSDKTRYTNSGITFSQAIDEMLSIISKLPSRKKFGITISCDFLVKGTRFGAEAFYFYRFDEESSWPATLRFNSRSITKAPKWVRDAGQKILDALNVTNFKIENE